MKKRKMVCIIIVLISLITLSMYLIYNSDKFRIIESTNLNKENINGVYLMERYDEGKIEKVFGEVFSKNENKDYCNYIYPTVSLKVDKDNNIIGIYTAMISNSLKTTKGISKDSTFDDVQKVYGNKFLKKKYSDFMGSGNGYWITYVDKNNKFKITFEFNEHNNGNLSNITLSKY